MFLLWCVVILINQMSGLCFITLIWLGTSCEECERTVSSQAFARCFSAYRCLFYVCKSAEICKSNRQICDSLSVFWRILNVKADCWVRRENAKDLYRYYRSLSPLLHWHTYLKELSALNQARRRMKTFSLPVRSPECVDSFWFPKATAWLTAGHHTYRKHTHRTCFIPQTIENIIHIRELGKHIFSKPKQSFSLNIQSEAFSTGFGSKLQNKTGEWSSCWRLI